MNPVILKPNILGASCNLLSLLSIKYSQKYVNQFLETHKDYPTLSSISSLLDDFNIGNVPVKIPGIKLSEAPLPAIAHFPQVDAGKFVVVTNASGEDIEYIDPSIGVIKESLTDFELKWKGVTLLAESNGNAHSEGNEKFSQSFRRKKIFRISNIVLGVIMLMSIIVSADSISLLHLLLLLKIIGAASAFMLLLQDLGIDSRIANNVCTLGGLSEKVGCANVSSSKASSIGPFKMSEVGLWYFTGGAIYASLASLNPNIFLLGVLFLTTVISLPYTFFSVYYQARVVKQLCPLCLVVMIVFWTEFLVMLPGITQQLNFTQIPILDTLTGLVVAYGIPLMFWLTFKESISIAGAVNPTRNKVKYFIESPEVINTILHSGRGKIIGEPTNTIILNPDGELIITAVISLYCYPCKIALEDMRYLAARNSKLRFEIMLFTDDPVSYQIARIALENKMRFGDEAAVQYMLRWYEKKLEESASPAENASTDFSKEISLCLREWQNWIRLNKISDTPSIYIDGALKPRILTLRELETYFKKTVTTRKKAAIV